MNDVYLGLGSNLGNRLEFLNKALLLIHKYIGEIKKQSSVYETEPWGFEHNNLFLNQVVLVETRLFPEEVLGEIFNIEKALGRIRTSTRYSARSIDIDILFYNSMILETNDLIIPQPQIANRKFVLVPMSEIDGEYVHPVFFNTINELLEACIDDSKVVKFNTNKKS